MAKKKRQGHYCRICDEHKANEKFSGKGHAKHICKACDSLPQEKKNELQYMNRIERIAEKHPRSREDWDLLEKYAKSRKYPEASEYAKMVLEMSGRQLMPNGQRSKKKEETYSETLTYDELDDDTKDEISDYLDETISDFLIDADYIPEKKHKQKILDELCCEISREYGSLLVPGNELNNLFDEILKNIITEFEEDGINISTYADSLVVVETERLKIRKFTVDDLPELHSIMEKPEVMYAWEHGFSRSETRKWINRQLTRYKKDGYGYFAVILKETGKLIGQVGLMKSEINGKEVVELGYIFDNLYWHQGYCMEVAKACVKFAFDKLELEHLYCSVRPNNIPSIRIAEKLGMTKVGEHIVNYKGMDMPHNIYIKTHD